VSEKKRRSLRLRDYDYAQAGMYFVTVCTEARMCPFGEIVAGQMRLNGLGHIVQSEWIRTAAIRPQVRLDVFAVMSNHFHAILAIDDRRGVLPYAPAPGLRSPSQTIGAIIRGWKAAVTKRVNQIRGTSGAAVWQHNFYEHVIRNEDDLYNARRYIEENPARWALDRENPEGMRGG